VSAGFGVLKLVNKGGKQVEMKLSFNHLLTR